MADEVAVLINDLKKSGDPASTDKAVAYTARYASCEASGTSTPLVLSLGRNQPNNRASCALLEAEAQRVAQSRRTYSACTHAPGNAGSQIRASATRVRQAALPRFYFYATANLARAIEDVCAPNGQRRGDWPGRLQRFANAHKDDMRQRLR